MPISLADYTIQESLGLQLLSKGGQAGKILKTVSLLCIGGFAVFQAALRPFYKKVE